MLSSSFPLLLLPAALSLLLSSSYALSIHPTLPQLHKTHFRPVSLSSRSDKEPPLLFGRQLSSSVDPHSLASCQACQAVYERTSACTMEDPRGAREGEFQVPIGQCICSEDLVSQLSACYSCAASKGADLNYLQSGMDQLSSACFQAGHPLANVSLSSQRRSSPSPTLSTSSFSKSVDHPESSLKPTSSFSPTPFQPSSSPPPLMKKSYIPYIKETVRWNSTHTASASAKQAAETGTSTSSAVERRESVALGVGLLGVVTVSSVWLGVM